MVSSNACVSSLKLLTCQQRISKILQINQTTKISTRSVIRPPEDEYWRRVADPKISELDGFFREAGVELAVQACRKTLSDAKLDAADITHTVAVTCTNAGNPGLDLLVAQQLGLHPDTDRTLLHGVGCAGGLSAMRAAAALAQSCSMRCRTARVLAFACELFTVNVWSDIDELLKHPETMKISPVLFSDAAAAFVLCNELALGGDRGAIIYELLNWKTCTIPDTSGELAFTMDSLGFRATLTKRVPSLVQSAVSSMFARLCSLTTPKGKNSPNFDQDVQAKEFDWALHPGGIAILNALQKELNLEQGQLEAAFDVYKNHGNSSSPTVLIVLDRLRRIKSGKENVVACSFGPGIVAEMAMLKRRAY